VINQGLQWKDAPKDYGPHKALYNRFIRWSRMGVFDRIFAGLSGQGPKPERIIIDATHLNAHRNAAGVLKKGLLPAVSGAPKGGLNSKLHAVCDGDGKPLVMLLTAGQMRTTRAPGSYWARCRPPGNCWTTVATIPTGSAQR